jgi:hypothetical protein
MEAVNIFRQIAKEGPDSFINLIRERQEPDIDYEHVKFLGDD